MPTFLGRRYTRPVQRVGRTEVLLGAGIVLLLLAILAAFAVHVATNRDYLFDTAGLEPGTTTAPGISPPTASPAGLSAAASAVVDLPAAGAGWVGPQNVGRFTPDTLYVKIDGGDGVYLQHGVVGLLAGSYVHSTNEQRMIDVYWYDMGTAENARAVYEAQASPEVEAIPLGAAGYQTYGSVYFRQDRHYIQVIPGTLGAEDAAAARELAERLAGILGPSVDPPAVNDGPGPEPQRP